MKSVDFFKDYDKVIQSLTNGAFLTVKDRNNNLNTMPIAWATLGIAWKVPVLMVMVRPSRYTFGLIKNADDFTVTFPFCDMKEQIGFCGTHSGRDGDKLEKCGLNAIPAQKVNSPIIEVESGRYYECKIVQATSLDKERLEPDFHDTVYKDRSYHTYYFGEIIACYEV
jgi:flavin reductase (DIM6/NTAB) family NADH-FMN oxidoreductase RutF